MYHVYSARGPGLGEMEKVQVRRSGSHQDSAGGRGQFSRSGFGVRGLSPHSSETRLGVQMSFCCSFVDCVFVCAHEALTLVLSFYDI